MARVSKTSPFPARRPAESRSNDEGQEQREETNTGPRSNDEGQEEREDMQTESNPEEDRISNEDESQANQKKRKGKELMKKSEKRGKGRRGPIKGAVMGLATIPETGTSPNSGIGRGRKTARKTTFAVNNALYELDMYGQRLARNSDPEGEGEEKAQEADEYEKDEACKRITNYERNKDDDRDKDYDGAHLHARFDIHVKI